jgi:hypothetical protein
MGVVSSKSSARARRGGPVGSVRFFGGRVEGGLPLVAWALSACSLDFDVAGRQFECPPEVRECVACNSDGTCRQAATVARNEPPRMPTSPVPPQPPLVVPDGGGAKDAGFPVPSANVPDASSVVPEGPLASDECDEFESRTSNSLCVGGSDRCFSLGDVLSPSLTLWLDPTTLPRDGARLWCDRSGKGHHAELMPEGAALLVDRAEGDALAASIALDGSSLSLKAGAEPVLPPGNFAVLMAAATVSEASAPGDPVLFDSGSVSQLSLTIARDTGTAVGRIASLETALVPDPVVTRSSVDDDRFHLYTLYRRSEVRVLDDVLQLRLNGVLEFRGSSIAMPRALDLSSPSGPRFGWSGEPSSGPTPGRARLSAIIILQGSLPEDELARLETFLCEALAVCEAPGPRQVPDPPVPRDGG